MEPEPMPPDIQYQDFLDDYKSNIVSISFIKQIQMILNTRS